MSRAERKTSSTGIYHVMIRGINKQLIFEEATDYSRFLSILSEVKQISGFKLFAYCLMGNHLHMLIKEGKEPLGQIFKRIGARYAFWFNWKYERSGHLFQDRFRSEPIESDEYLITVLLYIYQNPVKAGICKRPQDYKWSSRQQLGRCDVVDEAELFDIVSVYTIRERETEEILCEALEPMIGRRMLISDEDALALLKSAGGVRGVSGFLALDRKSQATVLHSLRENGVSIRQFSRVSGLSKGIVEKLGRMGKDA